jgi:hypothetical protein
MKMNCAVNAIVKNLVIRVDAVVDAAMAKPFGINVPMDADFIINSVVNHILSRMAQSQKCCDQSAMSGNTT